jgi:type I restriction enzyme S subunit
MREDQWTVVRLSDVSSLDIERVPVVASEEYHVAGVLNAGQGMLDRGKITGSGTRYSVLHRLKVDQLVMRRLTAWEGPITVVPPQLHGYFASPEFPTFTLRADRILPSYMRIVCQRPETWNQMRARSTGSVQRRKRVSANDLLKVSFPLPPLKEQRRIVDLLSAVDRSVAAAGLLAHGLQRVRSGLLERHLSGEDGESADANWCHARLDEITVLINRGRPPHYAAQGTTVLGQRCIRDGVARLDAARATDVAAKPVPVWAFLQPGDTLVNSTGRGTVGRVGYFRGRSSATTVDSHITIVRPDPMRVAPRYLAYLLETKQSELERLATGSTSQSELSRGTLAAHEVVLPPLQYQLATVDLIGSLDELRNADEGGLVSLHTLRTGLVAELLSGAHRIPASYDTLLGAS